MAPKKKPNLSSSAQSKLRPKAVPKSKTKPKSKAVPKSKAKEGLRKRFKKRFLFRGLKLVGVPSSFQPILEKEYLAGKHSGVLGFFIWEIRHKLKYGHRDTTINPSEFCKNLEQVRHLMIRIEVASKNTVNPNGIEIAHSLYKRLNAGHNEGIAGSLGEIEILKTRVNGYLRSQVKEPDFSPVSIDARILYEVEGRSGFDPDVIAHVSGALESEVLQNLEKRRLKQSSLQKTEDFAVLLNLYQSLEDLDATPFLCSHTLLSIVSRSAIMTDRREIHLGVFCTADTLTKIQEYLSCTFKYTLSDKLCSENFIQAKHASGLNLCIWRYEVFGAYMVARDAINEYLFVNFDFQKIQHNNFPFRAPADVDRYLTDQFGQYWGTPKFYNHTRFDYANSGYNRTPEALEFLTKRITLALEKNHRRPASRAIEDLNDYFGLDFMPYIPTREFKVDTPASRRRAKLSKEIRNAAVVCVVANAPSSVSVNAIQSVRRKYNHVTVMVLGAVSQQISDLFLLLKGVDRVVFVKNFTEWEDFQSKNPKAALLFSGDAVQLAKDMGLAGVQNEEKIILESIDNGL